jgi:acetylornithine deacetylase/succinyl-diaminopimelate desuccinylase-like protein
MNAWKEFQEANKDRFLQELLDLLRIPSVSAKSEHNGDMQACAKAVATSLTDAGAQVVKIYETEGHPIVYGEIIVDPSFPTVLVYGHYDVQPADPLELWHSGPFDPTIIDGKIFARGACDDKGQFYMHVKALEIMTKTNSMCTNIKFVIEGEEEIGSPNLATFVKANKDLLKADVILIRRRDGLYQ